MSAAPLTDEQIQALKSKHGSTLTLLSAANNHVVVRPPSRGEWKRYRTQMHDDAQRPDAAEHLLRACIVHPDSAQVEALLNRLPGLAESFGAAVLELAGRVETEKKAL